MKAADAARLVALAAIWGASFLFIRIAAPVIGPAATADVRMLIAGGTLAAGPEGSGHWLAIAASLGAAFCYGLTGVVLRRWGRATSARGMAAGTQLMGGVLLLPLLVIAPPAWPTPDVVMAMLALGLVSGALAYVLYFRLIADLGATGALTVTYLIPIFGVLWGALFLGEPLGGAMIV